VTDDKQAVVDESKAAAKPTAADDSARVEADPLDTLLSQWDEDQKAKQAATPPPAPPTQQPQDPPIDPQRIKRLEDRLFQEDLNEAVSHIAGDLKIPRRAAIGWLDQIAREKPAIGQAFLNKANDPRTWERFEKSLRKEMMEDFKPFQVDETATADREAVAQAVRGASTKPATEPPPKLGGKSNAEFRKHVIEQYGFDPGV
jgi:hypothetical protein